MSTFYDEWLGYWDKGQEEKRRARKVIHEEEIEWVSTVQDHRVGLLVAPETGFRTWGSESWVAEIPPGCHTGRHKHGEEAMHIVSGEGFSLVDGVRYDWRGGSTLLMPFGSEHQHFNTGRETARYFATTSVHLEHFCGLHRTTQLAERGQTTSLPEATISRDGFDAKGRRIRLFIEEAPVVEGGEGSTSGASGAGRPASGPAPEIESGKPIVLGTFDGYAEKGIPGNAHKARLVHFMRVGKDTNGFKAYEQEISGILTDGPHEAGGTHAHMEAHLYVLEGEGHSIVDGETIPWKAGSAFHIPGPQSIHQHVNDGDTPSSMLRIAPGVRYFFEAMAKDEFPYLYYAYREGYQERNQERERERTRG